MKPLVYVAGPYTRPDPVANTNRAVREALALWGEGECAVIIPHLTLLAHAIEPHAVEYWYEFDLDQVAHCDAVLRLSGDSSGADKEVAYALKRGIPVFYDTDDLRDWLATR